MLEPKWWYGVVEDVDDPSAIGRVRVRIYGVHEQNASILPTRYLPWASVMLPATSATDAGGVGRSPTGLQVGSEVLGISFDDSYNDNRVLFTWAAFQNGESDLSPLAQGYLDEVAKKIESSKTTGVKISRSNTVNEPSMDRNTKYPLNDVETSRAGFVTENDSSSGARNSEMHPEGSYREWRSDGGMVTKVLYLFKFVTQTLFELVGGSKITSVAGNVVNNFQADFYQQVTGQSTMVAPNGLYKHSESVELDTPEIRTPADIYSRGTLYIPEIRVRKLYVDNIECSGLMNGTAAYAKEAGKAGGEGPVTPVTGSGAGDLAFDMLLNDNGGDYPADTSVVGDKQLPLSYEINRPSPAVEEAYKEGGFEEVQKVDGAVAAKMFTDSLKYGEEGAWQVIQRSLNAMNDAGSWPILDVTGEKNQETLDALDKCVKRRGQAHVLNAFSGTRFAYILEKVQADTSERANFEKMVDDESFLKLPTDTEAEVPTV